MPEIIFITDLTLWSMGRGHGGPAFTQTIKKYVDKGWDVYLLSDEPSNEGYPELDSAHNICLKSSPFKKYGQIRKLGLLFRWLDHKVMTRRFIKTAERLLAGSHKDMVLYAYEIFGVEACRRLSKKYDIPFVTRFQGTILSQYSNTKANHIRRYPHYQALSCLSNLVIMTDDGTQGDRVLRELGNTSPTLFLRNGLELMGWDIPARIAAFDAGSFRAALGIGKDETMFLTVSRLEGWKKVDRAIRGFADYCRSSREGKLVIVGDGASRQELEALAESCGISERVIFVGSVPHDTVYDYMMAADVFLSLYDLSNVGNPLLEAMALGKCIITLDVGDTHSLIHDRENGILLTADVLPTLGAVMQELSENSVLCRQLGEAAAKYAQNNFCTWEKRMDREFQAVASLAIKEKK